MTLPEARRRGTRTLGACLLLALGASACRDAGGDPTAVLVTERTHPAIQLALELPSLPALAAEARIEGRVSEAVDRWTRSWTQAPGVGSQHRLAAYDEAAWPLAEALGRTAVEGALRRLEAVLATADGLDAAALPQGIAGRLASARAEAAAARRAHDIGVPAEALRATLYASDLLREAGPEGVARMLVARAETGLDAEADGGVEPGALERGERFVLGARAAVEDGDYTLAIQRAYYACQLLGLMEQ